MHIYTNTVTKTPRLYQKEDLDIKCFNNATIPSHKRIVLKKRLEWKLNDNDMVLSKIYNCLIKQRPVHLPIGQVWYIVYAQNTQDGLDARYTLLYIPI